MPVKIINLARIAAQIEKPFVVYQLAQMDDYSLDIYISEGAVMPHHHTHEDELFYVQQGVLTLETDWGTAVLQPDEMAVVPKGVNHRSWSLVRSLVLLFRCQLLADRKNGERRVISLKGEGELHSTNIISHIGDLDRSFDHKDLLHVDDCVVRLLLCRGYTRWHSHDHDELLMVQEGELALGTEHGPALVQPGEIVHIPAGLVHRLVSQRAVILCFVKESLSPREQAGQEFFGWTRE